MIRTLRTCLAAAALLAGGAQAQTQLLQTQLGVPPSLEVQRLAPQLVAFAGGDVNFQNLVNGLALGLPVTLTTPVAPGVTQIVSFTPAGTLTPAQVAQTLETARQAAIANGIATPTAQQISILLNGGALPTATGTTAVNALISSTGTNTAFATPTGNGSVPSPAMQLQQTPRFSRSDTPLPRGVADTPLTSSTSASPASSTATGGAATGGTTPTVPAGGGLRPAPAVGAGGVPRLGAR
jgi:hypothetical protein